MNVGRTPDRLIIVAGSRNLAMAAARELDEDPNARHVILVHPGRIQHVRGLQARPDDRVFVGHMGNTAGSASQQRAVDNMHRELRIAGFDL